MVGRKVAKMYNIRKFSELTGISISALRSWDNEKKLIANRTPGGHRIYTNDHLKQLKLINDERFVKPRKNVLYIRESSSHQKSSRDNQKEKVKEFCISAGYTIDIIYEDFGSGMNWKRPNFLKLLDNIINHEVDKLIMYHKDRLVRFGFELFEYLSKVFNFEIIVIDQEVTKDSKKEFVEDLIAIIHYFSMKLYGDRSYKKKVEKSTENLEEIKNEI